MARGGSDQNLLNENLSLSSGGVDTLGPSPKTAVRGNSHEYDDDLEGTVDDRVDELFEKDGGCGLFQVFAYFAIAFGMSAPSWFIYEVGFFTQ